MHGWWIAMGLFAAACLALAPTYNRHHTRRRQVARVRARLATWLPAHKQPDGTFLDSPDRGQALPRQPVPSGPRRRVVLGDTRALGATLSPGWRLR